MSSLFDNIKPLTIGQERLINVLKDDSNEVSVSLAPLGQVRAS